MIFLYKRLSSMILWKCCKLTAESECPAFHLKGVLHHGKNSKLDELCSNASVL